MTSSLCACPLSLRRTPLPGSRVCPASCQGLRAQTSENLLCDAAAEDGLRRGGGLRRRRALPQAAAQATVPAGRQGHLCLHPGLHPHTRPATPHHQGQGPFPQVWSWAPGPGPTPLPACVSPSCPFCSPLLTLCLHSLQDLVPESGEECQEDHRAAVRHPEEVQPPQLGAPGPATS